MAEKKKVLEFSDLLKILGALAVFIPLITAAVQYRQSVQQESDKNFHTIVEKLSSQNREERIAAAANMRTFIEKDFFGGKYYDRAVDILINRLSIELDYNVLNAIKGSLQKIEHDEYKKIIQKLLDVERNIFIQNYALKIWKEDAKEKLKSIEKATLEREEFLKKYKYETDRAIFNNLKDEISMKWEIFYNREKDFSELEMHKQVNADFIATFLEVTKYYHIEGLNFYLSSLNKARLIGLNFKKSNFERSAISRSIIEETIFDGATIIDTLFTFSDLTKSKFVNCKIMASLFNHITSLKGVSFSGSEFNDVFFAGSDLTEANFKGAKGLKPIYFYKAKNIEKAEFDNEFKIELTNELGINSKKMTDERFLEYIKSSELRFREDKIAELETTLNELKIPEQEKNKKKSKTF